ncbi:MAG TPA: hypothetical protein VH815_12505 [Acidobacteriota bacterium]
MRILCLIILLLPSFALSDTAFARRYPDSGAFFSIVVVEDGYVVAANRRDEERNRFEVLIMKVQPNTGIIVWKQIYGSGSDMIGWQLISTIDGGFALLGKRKLSDLARWDVLLLKLNSAGKLLWSKKYFDYFGDQKGQIVQTKDGGFIMTGVTENSKLILQHVNRSGNLVWNRAFEELFAYPIGLHSIGGGLYVSAIEESGEVVLLKFDGTGRIHSKKQFRSLPGISVTNSFLMSDSGFMLSGRFYLPDGRENVFLTRLNKNWNIVWTKSFVGEIQKPFGSVFGTLEVYDIKQTENGSIDVACQIYFPLKVPQTLLFQISLSGKVLDAGWFVGEDNTTPNLILPLDQKEILIAGPSFDTPSFGNLSGFLLKLDSEGKLPGCNSFQNLSVRELESPPVESIANVHVYPALSPPYEVKGAELQINIPFINGKTICR